MKDLMILELPANNSKNELKKAQEAEKESLRLE